MAIDLVTIFDYKRTKNSRINIRNIETQDVGEHGREDGMKTRKDGGMGGGEEAGGLESGGAKETGMRDGAINLRLEETRRSL